VTAEDPVEYQLQGVNQVHVNQQVGLTFSSVLRSVLRISIGTDEQMHTLIKFLENYSC
jgi:histidinol-phosphate/aromatic aminotransferase/cobyric acid decarboxylase-like protein